MRSAAGRPVNISNSPSWGVRMVGDSRCRSNDAAPSAFHASANRPSPSITAGSGDCTATWRVLAAVSSLRPRPGPSTNAWKRSNERSASPSPSRWPATGAPRPRSAAFDASATPGTDTCTMPAPVLRAGGGQRRRSLHGGATGDDAHRRAHLCASLDRPGHHPATSSACARATRGDRAASRPMSATSSSPARSRPGGNSRPGFNAANVTVRSAASTRRRWRRSAR